MTIYLVRCTNEYGSYIEGTFAQEGDAIELADKLNQWSALIENDLDKYDPLQEYVCGDYEVQEFEVCNNLQQWRTSWKGAE